jgi:hypothetical protein
LRELNPARLPFALFSDRNPFLAPVAAMADWVRENRRPVGADNPFLAAQEQVSRQIEAALDGYRDGRDALMEASFHALYGAPLLQALLGLGASDAPPRARPGRDPEERAFVARRIAELRADMAKGGLREAAIRALLHVGLPGKAADERAFAVIRKLRSEQEHALPLAAFKALVRDQFLMLLIDEDRAIATLPELTRGHEGEARAAVAMIEQVARARGELGEEAEARLRRIGEIFGAAGGGDEGRTARRRTSAKDAAGTAAE